MTAAEQIFRYPRRLTLSLNIVATIIAIFAAIVLGRELLRIAWEAYGFDPTLIATYSWLRTLVRWLHGAVPPPAGIGLRSTLLQRAPRALGSLALAGSALWITSLLANCLPALRPTARALHAQYAGEWLTIPWEMITAIRSAGHGDRWVLLIETTRETLTRQHVWYCLWFRLRTERALLVTSSINQFDLLVRALLDGARSATITRGRELVIEDDAPAPFARLLLGPAVLFAAREPAPDATTRVEAAEPPDPSTHTVTSPRILVFTLRILALAIALGAGYRTLLAWQAYLVATFPALPIPGYPPAYPAPWWALVGAHGALALLLFVAATISELLPTITVNANGLHVRMLHHWITIPWSRIRSVAQTSLHPDLQVLLIRCDTPLPTIARVAGLLYDGNLASGILLASSAPHADALVQRIHHERARIHAPLPGHEVDRPHATTQSTLLRLCFARSATMTQMVEDSRGAQIPLTPDALLRFNRASLAVALSPALIVLADYTLRRWLLPDARTILFAVLLALLGLLETPLAALVALWVDTASGGDTGAIGMLLYPNAQLPRVLLYAAALVATMLALPNFAVLCWLAATAWCFVLTAELWATLYDWRGIALVATGMTPVVYQLVLLIMFLLFSR